MKSTAGQSSLDYILVVAVLSIAIGAFLSSEQLRSAFANLYAVMATRIMGP